MVVDSIRGESALHQRAGVLDLPFFNACAVCVTGTCDMVAVRRRQRTRLRADRGGRRDHLEQCQPGCDKFGRAFGDRRVKQSERGHLRGSATRYQRLVRWVRPWLGGYQHPGLHVGLQVRANGFVQICWNSELNNKFALQYRTNLSATAGAWLNLGSYDIRKRHDQLHPGRKCFAGTLLPTYARCATVSGTSSQRQIRDDIPLIILN